MLSESKFLELYHRQQESGLTVKEFCSNEGIAPSTFHYWKKKLKRNNSRKAFIPLVVKPSQVFPAQSNTKNRHTVPETGKTDDNVLLELEYPNGTKLRIKKDMDLVHLQSLICLFD